MRYNQGGFPSGMASCDQLLSHVDVISLLVRKHCIRLIPSEPLGPKTMRALRDRLIEEELWDLAIEVCPIHFAEFQFSSFSYLQRPVFL